MRLVNWTGCHVYLRRKGESTLSMPPDVRSQGPHLVDRDTAICLPPAKDRDTIYIVPESLALFLSAERGDLRFLGAPEICGGQVHYTSLCRFALEDGYNDINPLNHEQSR